MKRLVGIRASPALLASMLQPGTKLTLVFASSKQATIRATRTVIFSDEEFIILMDNGSCIQLAPDDLIELYDDGFVLTASNGLEATYLWGHV
jgi:hypothetical protein